MVKEGQVLTQFCPDWLYGIHFQARLRIPRGSLTLLCV